MGVALVAIALVCAGTTQLVTAAPRSTAIGVQPAAAISQTPTTIGVADSAMYFYSQAQIEQTLDALQSLGVQNVRIQIPWAGVQLWGPNAYDWTTVDWAVEAAQARNMGVLAVLSATPWWAGRPYLSGQPDSPEAYAKFAGAVADRYEGRIAAYEIWNEPNARIFLDPVDPAGYTDLLTAAYPAIKAADPSAIVVAGVVGSVITAGNVTMNPVDFVAGMYAAGAHGFFDALSFHPYQYTLKFSDGQSVLESPLRQLNQIRQLMVLNGDGELKVWASEYGLPTSAVSEQDQADFIEDFLNSWQTVDGTGPIFIYTTRDIDSSSTADGDTFGIFFDDGQLKEAARVIARFLGVEPPNPDPDPDRPVLAAIAALARELARITGEVIQFGVDVGKAIVKAVVETVEFLVKATAAVIRGVVDLTVDLVTAGADLVRDVVDRFITAITDPGSPPGMAVASLSVDSAPVARRAAQPSDDSIAPAAQRVSAAAEPVAGDDAVAAEMTGDASSIGKAGHQEQPAEPLTVGDEAQTPKEAAEPATTTEPSSKAEPTAPSKPADEATPATPNATVGEPAKTATKPRQATDQDESGSAPQGKPAATGGEGSATDARNE